MLPYHGHPFISITIVIITTNQLLRPEQLIGYSHSCENKEPSPSEISETCDDVKNTTNWSWATVVLLYWQRRVERHSPPLPRSSSLFNCDYCSYFATGHALIRKTSPAAGGIMKQRQTAGHWTEKQRKDGMYPCHQNENWSSKEETQPNPTSWLSNYPHPDIDQYWWFKN